VKVLAPAVTCVLVSHMKPPYLGEAIQSALRQTRRDIAIIVADSGQWIGDEGSESGSAMAELQATYCDHPLVEWVTTGEPPNLKASRCPVAWATNQVIRSGLVRGRYMCTFYDDDRYLPRFMEVMAGALDEHPEWRVVWCSQKLSGVGRDGTVSSGGIRLANEVRGPGQLDCQVDGGQVMWRTDLLDLMTDPWMAEEPGTCSHSDGLFLERLAGVAGNIWPVGEVLCENRKTPLSAYTPT
jgi:hypothetical protein